MKESYKVLVKVYHYKGNEYAIIKGEHDGIIRAINYKYVDSSRGQRSRQAMDMNVSSRRFNYGKYTG